MQTLQLDRGEPIGDLVRDYHSDIVRSCQVAEELAEADEFGGALRHCEAPTRACACARLAIIVGELCAVVCGDRVQDHKADVIPGYCDG